MTIRAKSGYHSDCTGLTYDTVRAAAIAEVEYWLGTVEAVTSLRPAEALFDQKKAGDDKNATRLLCAFSEVSKLLGAEPLCFWHKSGHYTVYTRNQES